MPTLRESRRRFSPQPTTLLEVTVSKEAEMAFYNGLVIGLSVGLSIGMALLSLKP